MNICLPNDLLRKYINVGLLGLACYTFFYLPQFYNIFSIDLKTSLLQRGAFVGLHYFSACVHRLFLTFWYARAFKDSLIWESGDKRQHKAANGTSKELLLLKNRKQFLKDSGSSQFSIHIRMLATMLCFLIYNSPEMLQLGMLWG